MQQKIYRVGLSLYLEFRIPKVVRVKAYKRVRNGKVEKVRSVKGKRADNLIWVNTFLQYQQVYVPKSAYNFVWNYITERCVNAKIIYG